MNTHCRFRLLGFPHTQRSAQPLTCELEAGRDHCNSCGAKNQHVRCTEHGEDALLKQGPETHTVFGAHPQEAEGGFTQHDRGGARTQLYSDRTDHIREGMMEQHPQTASTQCPGGLNKPCAPEH